jgi:hypothetical protein
MKKIQIYLYTSLILMIVATGNLQGDDIQVQTEEIVRRFITALRNIPEVFAIEAKTQFLMKTSTGEETKQITDIKYYRDGRCVDIEDSVHNYSLVNGKTDKTSDVPFYQRAIVDRKNRAFYYDSKRKDRVPQNVVFWSDGEKVFDRMSKQIGTGRALEGYVAYDHISLIELLSDKTSSLHYKGLEDIEGSKYHVLEATIKNYGSYTLWLDPQHNCLPRKVSVTKKDKDIYGTTPVSELKLAHGSLAEVSYFMDSVKFKDFDGVLLPVACKTTLIWKYSSGKTAEWHGEHQRLSIDLKPDFEALSAFEPNIPDGTRINYQDFVGKNIRFEWRNGKVVPVDTQLLSLMGKSLPELKDLGIKLSQADAENKMILVCFFDMQQRPSRHYIGELARRAEELKQKGITVVAAQASKINENKLNEWVKKNNIPFPVVMIQGDVEKTHFTWGVRSLPWLLLTDKENVIQSEGFAFSELENKLNQIKGD